MAEKKAWTGKIVSLLHVHNITQKELAEELGVTHNYVSMLLNGKMETPGIEQRMKDGINNIIERRASENTDSK